MKTAYESYRAELAAIREAGTYKDERIITTPQKSRIDTTAAHGVVNMCANNYLGLSDDPRLIEAAKASYDRWGFGLSSVRFICGTQEIHKTLERKIADFVGMEDAILYSSCFDANGGLFETLLGADDKAGIAEILTAVEEIIREDIPHGDIWIGFTPDEEVGRGADLFNLDYFKADFAYTVDGDYEGEIAYENFNAAAASFKIKGVNVHPGSAKDIMVNAAAVACEIQSLLPEAETPEHTEGREGFFSLMHMSGEIAHAELSYIIRDHDRKRFEERKALLASIADQMNQKYHADTVSLTVTDSYYNMLEVMKDHMYVIEIANEAIKTVGIPLVSTPVRGGTDGARLSYMGLPCPNLGTGGYGFHGPYEHITVEGMEHAVKIIKEIVKHPVEK